VSADAVRGIVSEWIERRPLEHIRACRYPFVTELFAALERQGKTVGVFSDYPAAAKLHEMELHADHVVYAGDANVGLLKPNPRGLEVLMDEAGARPSETVMIGDRIERDGEAAKRVNAKALIRSDRTVIGFPSFARYSDPVFDPLLSR
jgi:putative hydrolase of the HAD superfamily